MRSMNIGDFSQPSVGELVWYTKEMVEDARCGLERDFSEHLGYPIRLIDPPNSKNGDDVTFVIHGAKSLTLAHEEVYRKLFWQHLHRVAAFKTN